MTLEITKEQFEKHVPVATSPNDKVFNMVAGRFDEAMAEVERIYLGKDLAADIGSEPLLKAIVTRYVCKRAFLNSMASLDVTLTATGFGVVSNQQLTPASRQRVEAVKAETEEGIWRTGNDMLDELVWKEGWYRTHQARSLIKSPIYSPYVLLRSCGIKVESSAEWKQTAKTISDATAELTRRMGKKTMDVLLDMARQGDTLRSPYEDYDELLGTSRRYIAAAIEGQDKKQRQMLADIIETLEGDLETFQYYKDSKAYKVNHADTFENSHESPASVFC